MATCGECSVRDGRGYCPLKSEPRRAHWRACRAMEATLTQDDRTCVGCAHRGRSGFCPILHEFRSDERSACSAYLAREEEEPMPMVVFKFSEGDRVGMSAVGERAGGRGTVSGCIEAMNSDTKGLYPAYNLEMDDGTVRRKVPESRLEPVEKGRLPDLDAEADAGPEPFVYPDEATGIEFSGEDLHALDPLVRIRIPAAPESKSYMTVEVPLGVLFDFSLRTLLATKGFKGALRMLCELDEEEGD